MPPLPPRVIGDAFASDRAWSTLDSLTAIGNRMSGQEGERRAGKLLNDRFEALGLQQIESSEFDIPGWWRGSSALSVSGPYPRTFERDHEIIALPGTSSCDIEGEVVDLGFGLPEDFEDTDLDGKLALVSSWVPEEYDRWVHRQEKYTNAVEAGAVGFLFRSHIDGGVPPTGFVSFGGTPAEIPGVGLSKEAGDRVSRMSDSQTTARLTIECETGTAVSRNVSASVGPDTESEVVLGAHYDAHDIAEGAGDNGCGVAILLEVGRLLSSVEASLETEVRLVGFGAEEAGMFGSEYLAETSDRSAIKCMLNLDGIGDSRTPRLYPNGFEALERAFETACHDLHLPYNTEQGIFAHGDQWPFVRRGVPAAMIGSGNGGRAANAHTHNDTIDKIDRRDLRDLAIGVTNYVLRMAEADRTLDPVSPETVRGRIDEETRITLERQGRWDPL